MFVPTFTPASKDPYGGVPNNHVSNTLGEECVLIARIVAEHPRSFGRGGTIYDPWHYVPGSARKPGALRNGAPFKDGVLPAATERVRRKLASADDGNRQMVDILNAVATDGLPAVEAASPTASIPPTSCSASWIGNVSPPHR